MPSNKEIKAAAMEVLSACDVDMMTFKMLRGQLEVKFGCELTDRKDVIRESLETFISQNKDLIEYDTIIKAENELSSSSTGADMTAHGAGSGSAKKKTNSGGFKAPVQLSTELGNFLGESVMPRTEVTKRVWEYIRTHNLQNPSDRREIVCDEKLFAVLKKKKINMFKMSKELSKMMKTYTELQELEGDESEDDEEEEEDEGEERKGGSSSSAAKSSKRNAAAPSKKRKSSSSSSASSSSSSGSKKKAKTASKYSISASLASLLGLDVHDTRYQVVAKMWEYIRKHELQNPADRRTIRLDKALEDIFHVKTFTIFSMNKHISEQMILNEATS